MTSINSNSLLPELEQKHGVFWKCIERTETGFLYRLRKKYRHLDYNWGSSDLHYGLNKAARAKQDEIFPQAETIRAEDLKWTTEKLQEFGYRFFEDASGNYFLELPTKEHLAARVQEKWPEVKEGIGSGEDVSNDYLQHLFGLSDGKQFVTDHSMRAMPTLMTMLFEPDYQKVRERGRALVADRYARMQVAQVDLEKRFGRGEEVARVKFFMDFFAGTLGSTSPKDMEEFIQMMSGTTLLEKFMTQMSNELMFRRYWKRTFNESFDVQAFIEIWHKVFAYEPVAVTSDVPDEIAIEEELALMFPEGLPSSEDLDINDPRLQTLLIKHIGNSNNSVPFAEFRSRFDGVTKSEELSAWLESEEKALQQKESALWEATSRARTKSGYIYEFKYKADLESGRIRLEIFPAVEPIDDYTLPLLKEDILLLKEFGFDFRKDENGIFLRIPDRDHLQACIQKAYPELNEEIINSEGIADDISFIHAFLERFLLISDGKEFVHDSIFHVVPTLKFIKNHGLASFRSFRQISRNHVAKLLEKVEKSEQLDHDPILKGKIITMIGVDADGLWSRGSERDVQQIHSQLTPDEPLMSTWSDSSFQYYWQRTHGEEIDFDRAKALWGQPFPKEQEIPGPQLLSI